ncbi:MAG: mitochondrial fission ELM1 family protein [Proteobacteria bacterium]|nr:mitochondrial fission ELM1 family protein [Pseudomonadota bacterium]
MENQALGLAERLALPISIKHVGLDWPWRVLAPRLVPDPLAKASAASSALAPPWPKLVIGCGRQSIPFVEAIKRASGGRTLTVQCQHPRVNPARFDLVIPPEHDGLTGRNVFPIIGSPNRITRAKLNTARDAYAQQFHRVRAPRLGVLIGGKSKAYTFDRGEAEAIGRTLAHLSSAYGLMVTASRRTGAENLNRIEKSLEGTDAYFWNGTGESPFFGILAWADAFLATSDSVNMACEAAVTGKPVHIFPLPGGSAKFARFHKLLEEKGIARQFEGRIEQWNYPPLDETGRAAKEIQRLLDLFASRPDMKM